MRGLITQTSLLLLGKHIKIGVHRRLIGNVHNIELTNQEKQDKINIEYKNWSGEWTYPQLRKIPLKHGFVTYVIMVLMELPYMVQ